MPGIGGSRIPPRFGVGEGFPFGDRLLLIGRVRRRMRAALCAPHCIRFCWHEGWNRVLECHIRLHARCSIGHRHRVAGFSPATVLSLYCVDTEYIALWLG